MGFSLFGRKTDFNKEYSLENIPLFSSLSPSELKTIQKLSRLIECKKGDQIYKKGQSGDAFYVVISGRFRVFQKEEDEIKKTVAYFHRGDYFGEISILTEKPHSVYVEAMNDALLFKIDKQDFLTMMKEMSALSLHLTRSLGHRLKKKYDVEKVSGSKIISVFSVAEGIGKTSFLVNFAASLCHYARKKVVVVDLSERAVEVAQGILEKSDKTKAKAFDLHTADFNHEKAMREHIYKHRAGFDFLYMENETRDTLDQKVISLLTFLLIHYDVVLVDMSMELKDLSLKILTQSDCVYMLTTGERENLEKAKALHCEFEESFKFGKNDIRVLVTQNKKASFLNKKQMERILLAKIFALFPDVPEMGKYPLSGEVVYANENPKSPYSRVVRYLSREITGTLVGLVLGSGAAFGLAHIGVIKVLEEENIPIDIIAGSSIGAFVGTMWAAGYDADGLVKIAYGLNSKSKAFMKLLGIRDFSVAHRGFFKGNRLLKYMRSLIEDKTFQELRTPMRIVATSLFSSEEVVFSEGDVATALRASISVPGILRPYKLRGKYYIDGGVVDPLPVKVLAKEGVSKIISVNVLSRPSQFEERKDMYRKKMVDLIERRKKEKNFFGRLWLQFKINTEKKYMDNIFNVLMNTIQFMEYKISSTAEQESDVQINPVVSDGYWAEFYEPKKFIEIGEEKAREKLDEIKALLEER